MAVPGGRLYGLAPAEECRAVSAGTDRHYVLPAAGCAAGAKSVSAPACRHRLEGAGQTAVLAGRVVWPGSIHPAGRSAVFCRVPLPAGLSCSWLVAAYGGEMDAQTLRSELGVSTLSYLLQNGLFAVILAPAINMFPALGEEVGWRGYMMPRLKERFGLLNGRLLGGVVWGVWHWP